MVLFLLGLRPMCSYILSPNYLTTRSNSGQNTSTRLAFFPFCFFLHLRAWVLAPCKGCSPHHQATALCMLLLPPTTHSHVKHQACLLCWPEEPRPNPLPANLLPSPNGLQFGRPCKLQPFFFCFFFCLLSCSCADRAFPQMTLPRTKLHTQLPFQPGSSLSCTCSRDLLQKSCMQTRPMAPSQASSCYPLSSSHWPVSSLLLASLWPLR